MTTTAKRDFRLFFFFFGSTRLFMTNNQKVIHELLVEVYMDHALKLFLLVLHA